MDNDSVRIKVLELSSENTILKYSNQAASQELADAYEEYIVTMWSSPSDESFDKIQKLKTKHNIK